MVLNTFALSRSISSLPPKGKCAQKLIMVYSPPGTLEAEQGVEY